MTERTLYAGTYTQRDSEGIYIFRFDTERRIVAPASGRRGT